MSRDVAGSVVTGSAAQVPTEIAEKLGIEIIPFITYVNGKEYLDGVNLTPGELYQNMRSNQLEVKTASPTVGQYYEVFKKLIERGVQEILCVTISSKLSADFSSAKNAANLLKTQFPDSKITIFDSRRAAVPQGLLAIEAAEKLQSGMPMEEVLAYLESEWPKTSLIAALDTLEYLNRGGRIGKAAIYVGSSLHILPIVYLNSEGIVAPAAIVRRKDKIIPTLISQLKKQSEGHQKIRLAVMHADALERAEELRSALQAEFSGIEIPIDEFTPVMGAHAGPGLLGVGYLYE